jgi:uncharacterized protein (DUF58 family)
VLAGLAVLAFLGPWQLALAGAGVALVAAATDVLVARRGRGEVVRTTQASVGRGRPVPLRLATDVRLPSRLKQPQTAELRVEPREAHGRELDASLVALRRGRLTLPEPVLRVHGPAGLAGWGGAAGVADELDVYSDLPGARRLARAAREGRLRSESRRRGPLGLGTEFESVREYHDEDDARHINWRATQRVGRPLTNQFRVERDRDVIVLVDCGRLVAAPIGDGTRLDIGVDAALAIAAVADELGDRAGLVAFDDELRRVVAPRRKGARTLLAALHDLEPRPVDSDYRRALTEVGGAKRAFVLVLTDLVEPAAAQPLVDALPLLVRRHAVAVASVSDPALVALLATRPRTEADALRQLAAADVDRDRAGVVTRLRGAGVQVVEAPPAAFSAACVRAYLDAKARSRL